MSEIKLVYRILIVERILIMEQKLKKIPSLISMLYTN